jgi:Tol biopolymer transport system component
MGEWTGRMVLLHAASRLAATGAVLTNLSCGERDITEPGAASLEVTSSTSGLEADANGYTVQLDGDITRALGPGATLRTTDIAPGNHTVQLGGVAANCRVAGENPRAVTVPAGGTTTVAFEVTCRPTGSSLQVLSSTTGPAPDADGYSISLDGAERGTLAQSDEVTLGGLAPGDHLVGLSGVTGNCQVEGDNPRDVTLTAGESITAAFEVACEAPPPNPGTIRLSTTTSGGDPDVDGYGFTLDIEASQPIGLNASTTLDNVIAGTHMVRLSGIAENCSLEGANPRSISVSAAATADVSFALTCSIATGTIPVSVTTSGTAPDPDGYLVQLDGGDSEQPIAGTGTVSFGSVAAGTHLVTLTEVTANCSVIDEASRTVVVTAGGSSDVSFVVSCDAKTGSIEVATATSGPAPDFDGYTIALDKEAAIAIEQDGRQVFGGVSPGPHQVALAGLPAKCRTDDENPREVIVTAGGTATIAFAISCEGVPVLEPGILFGTSRGDNNPAVFLINADGSNQTEIAAGAKNPAWSPDRTRIAFTGPGFYSEIWVMNADGSGALQLTNSHAQDQNPTWSPDGSKIAFVSDRDGNQQIYAMNADGSGQIRLTDNPARDDQPDWSPDGSKIAFMSERDEGPQAIFVMNADGTNPVRLGNNPWTDAHPAWSPDGRKLAFTSSDGGGLGIYVMNADGSGRVRLTDSQNDFDPTWSPDGSKIAFVTEREFATGSHEIFTMNADGSEETNLTRNPGQDYDPSW